MPPSSTSEPDRYAGRPLLIVLDNYVLASIGALPPDKDAGMARVVQGAFGGDGDWRATVRRHLRLDESLDDALRLMWAEAGRVAREGGADLPPAQFARMVVDQNFAALIEALPGSRKNERG